MSAADQPDRAAAARARTSTCSASASPRSTAPRPWTTTWPPPPGGGRAPRPRRRALPVQPRGRAGRRHPRGPRPLRRHRHQPGRLHPLRLEHPRRAGRLRRPGRRAAPVQPERPRAVAAHERRRPGGDRQHRRLRRRRLPARRRGGRRPAGDDRAARALVPADGRGRPARRGWRGAARGRAATRSSSPTSSTSATSPASPARRPGCSCCPGELVLRHRRPLRRPGRRAAGRAPASTPGSRSVGRTAAQRDAARPAAGAGIGRLGLEAAQRAPGPSSGATPSCFAGAELVATTGLVEALAAGEGRRRGGPHRRWPPTWPAGAGRTCIGLLDREPTEDEFGLASTPRCAAWAPRARASRRSWPAGPNAGLPAPPPRRPPHRRGRPRRARLRRPGRRLPLRHDPHGRCSASRRAEQAELLDAGHRGRRRSGVAAVRAGVSAARRRRRLPRPSSPTPAGASASPTAPATASACASTRRRGWTPPRPTSLAAGVVVTVEPGVYRGTLGGVRVEDTVVVTADGCRPLTTTPKDLACLRSPPTT